MFWVPLAARPTVEQKKQQQHDSPPGPPPGEGEVTHHLRQTVSSIIRSPVSGPLAPALTTRFGGGLDGLGILPVTGSTTLPSGRLLRQRGSSLRGCSRVGISRFPPEHEVSDRQELYLLLLHVSETQPEIALLDHLVHVEPQGHDHPCAGLLGLWPGGLWGISSYGRALA